MPTDTRTDLLTPRRILWIAALFLAVVFGLHALGRAAAGASFAPLGIGRWFPISYGYLRTPTLPQSLVTALAMAAAWFGIPSLRRQPERRRFLLAALFGLLTIGATTAIQGSERGFVHPLAGREPHAGGQQYWHDAGARQIVTAAAAADLLRGYDTIQPTLHEHARTHPPGAVLLFALLRNTTGDRPALAAVLLCTLAVALTLSGLRVLIGARPAFVLLYLLLPAVQVYYLATLDALIAGLLLVAIAHHTRARGGGDLAVAIIALLAVSFLTFGWVWAVPVLLAAEVALPPRPLPWRTALLLLALFVFYVTLHTVFDFDYLAAFRFASHSENPQGFRLFAEPLAYLATRLEDIVEPLVFCGPFVLLAVGKGVPALRRELPKVFVVTVAAVGTLLALFLTGAFRTGETARACLFVLPFLTLPAAFARLGERDQDRLCRLVFAQAVLMQLFGFYFW